RARTKERIQRVNELDDLLRDSRTKTLDRIAFRDRTADLLGPPRLTEEVVAEYRTLCDQLLTPACAALKQYASKPRNDSGGSGRSGCRRSAVVPGGHCKSRCWTSSPTSAGPPCTAVTRLPGVSCCPCWNRGTS